ncbi:translocation protein SEC63 homolog [Oscarella lobularis]|uniref:translocation protein SEC63 homolog n=1 Tax=Oscarella lobularis TaxID=121494 RepID=UPI0033143D34
MGRQFEYDETGVAAVYFFVCFLAVLLLPITYVLWPISKRKDSSFPSSTSKGKQTQQPSRSISLWKSVVLALGWSFLAFLVYRATTMEVETVEFDPFEILEINRDASPAKIRQQYRRLSLKYHPDKEDGDPERFMLITKAHATLTDEEARKNWELYGHPDGPGAVRFGIALPSWIVEKENSFWFLMAYVIGIVIVLPLVVGCWWYNKIKFSGDDILLDTQNLYRYYLGTSSWLTTKRLVMIVGASFEFWRRFNKEIMERPDDNDFIPRLIKKLGNLNEKNRESVICLPHSLKTRTLLHAHFSREPLPTKGLEADLKYILRKCPSLIKELVTVASLLTLYYQGQDERKNHKKQRINKKEKRRREFKPPGIPAIEGCIKLSQMVVQAMWDQSRMGHPLLMLPYVTERTLKLSAGRKSRVQSVKDFLALPDARRRELLEDALADDLDENLTDEQYKLSIEERYNEILAICGSYPNLDIDVAVKVLGEEENEYVTTNSYITLKITIERKSCQDLIRCEDEEEEREPTPGVEDVDKEKTLSKASRPWEKNKKKKGKKAKPAVKPKKAKTKKVGEKSEDASQAVTNSIKNGSDSEPASEDEEGVAKRSIVAKRSKDAQPLEDVESESSEGGDVDENAVREKDSEATANDGGGGGGDGEFSILDDEEKWLEMQKDIRRQEKVLVTKSTETHVCYAPRFPGEKHEWWWLYVIDEKKRLLQSVPKHVMTLKDVEEVEVQFSAPPVPGVYTYTVWLRSDCYVGFDQCVLHKVEVHKEDKESKADVGDDEATNSDEDADENGDEDEDEGMSFSEDDDDGEDE